MAKRTSKSGTRARVAGRKSPAGGRGSTRTAGGRTRTGGGGRTKAAGGTKSRGGAKTATTKRARGAAAGSRKRTGGTRSTGRASTKTRRTTGRRGAGRARATGQISEQQKRRLAAQAGGTITSSTRGQSHQNRTHEESEFTTESAGEFQGIRGQQNFNEEELLYRTSDYRQQKRMEEDVFAPTIQKANLWLKEVMDEIGTEDRHRAHTALKSVLQTLRDRLTVEEAVDLASQLPTIIRGIYFEGWKPAGKPIKYSKEEFISVIADYFQSLSGINHGDIIRAVFTVLQRHIATGEINHVIGTLPEEFAEFWMEEEPVNP